MDREELIAKIASEMLESVAAEVENEPLNKEASEEDKVQAVADKLAAIYNEQEAIKEAAEAAYAEAEEQEKIALEAIEESGYELTATEEAE